MSDPTEVCDEWEWDGPYRFKCRRWIVDGECSRHGSKAKRTAPRADVVRQYGTDCPMQAGGSET